MTLLPDLFRIGCSPPPMTSIIIVPPFYLLPLTNLHLTSTHSSMDSLNTISWRKTSSLAFLISSPSSVFRIRPSWKNIGKSLLQWGSIKRNDIGDMKRGPNYMCQFVKWAKLIRLKSIKPPSDRNHLIIFFLPLLSFCAPFLYLIPEPWEEGWGSKAQKWHGTWGMEWI